MGVAATVVVRGGAGGLVVVVLHCNALVVMATRMITSFLPFNFLHMFVISRTHSNYFQWMLSSSIVMRGPFACGI